MPTVRLVRQYPAHAESHPVVGPSLDGPVHWRSLQLNPGGWRAVSGARRFARGPRSGGRTNRGLYRRVDAGDNRFSARLQEPGWSGMARPDVHVAGPHVQSPDAPSRAGPRDAQPGWGNWALL